MPTPSVNNPTVSAVGYPVSDDPLLQAAWAHFGLDQQIAAQLKTLSDKVDGLRLQLKSRNSTFDAFSNAVNQAPAGAATIDFLQVDAAGRDRVMADLTSLGLFGQVSVVSLGGSPALYTFRVDSADVKAVGDGLSQGLQALMTTSQTQQLELQNDMARYSTLGETVASLQKSYVSLARTVIQSMGS